MHDVFISKLRDKLKKNGYKLTPQRLDLFKSFGNRPALTISQLSNLLPNLDKATVYRNVNLFEELGIVTRVQIGWKYKLELTDQFSEHHHHLTCNNCHKSIDIKDSQSLDTILSKLTRQHGYAPKGHHIELQGLCPKCQATQL